MAELDNWADWLVLAVELTVGLAVGIWLNKRFGKRLLRPLERWFRRVEHRDSALDRMESYADWQAFVRADVEAALAGGPQAAGALQVRPILYLQGFVREGQGRVYWRHASAEGDADLIYPVRIQSFLEMAFHGRPCFLVGVGGANSEVVKLSRGDDAWRATVWQLIDMANAIILRPFHSPSVLQELRYVLVHAPDKLLLVMDPTDTNFDGSVGEDELRESRFEIDGEVFDVAAVWEGIRSSVADLIDLPAYRVAGGFIGVRQVQGRRHAELGPFEASYIAAQVDARGGFVHRYAEVSLSAPGHPPAPMFVPAHSLDFTPAQAESAVRDIFAAPNYLTGLIGRPPTPAELAEQASKVELMESNFVAWHVVAGTDEASA